ncbi:MAG TPA: carboxymuconolactone decarboxylase family protein [Pseudolabrys sp.]|nr:carboxymuconolactone decarboxylase family protein [Pseudolabrys sp.]
MSIASDRMHDVSEVTNRLRKEFPRETDSFLAFLKEAEDGPNLDAKTKELMSVALSVAAQCEWCIAFHVRNAGKLGATRAEIIEAGFQAIVMHGGPAFMYMERLYDAADTYAADAEAK